MRASMLIYAALFLAGYGVRATIDCDESLIVGTTDEFTFAAATKELACNDGKEIVLDNIRYAALTCSDQRGWLSGGAPLTPPIAASEQLSIQCLAPEVKSIETPPPACDKRLIKGLNEDLMEYKSNELRCKTPLTHQLSYVISATNIQVAEVIKCDSTAWIADVDSYKIPNNATIQVICEKKHCHESLINMTAKVHYGNIKTEGYDAQLSCVDSSLYLLIYEEFYGSLSCVKNSVWGNDGVLMSDILPSDATFDVDCVEKACHPLLITADDTVGRAREGALSCDKAEHGLVVNGDTVTVYPELECNKTVGWRSVLYKEDGSPSFRDLETNQIGAEETIEVTCKEIYCQKSLISDIENIDFVYNDDSVEGKYIDMYCKDDEKDMFIDNKFYDELKCTKDGGWTGDNEGKMKEASAIFAANCVQKACFPKLASLIGDEPLPKFNELNHLICDGDRELHVTIDGRNHYGSDLHCDAEEGKWIITEWNSPYKFANADQEFDVECVEKTCNKELLTLDDNVEYERSGANEVQLTCPDSYVNMRSLFANEQFYDYLRCAKRGQWQSAPHQKLGTQLTVKCENRVCHKSLLNEINGTIIDKSIANELKCRDLNKELRTGINYKKYGDIFQCRTEGWYARSTDGNEQNIKPSVFEMNPVCVEKSCSRSLIIPASNTTKFTFDPARHTLACDDIVQALVINNKFMCNKVTCEKEKFWETEKGEIIDQATKTITAECKAKACDNRLIKKHANVVLHESNHTLECNNKRLQLNIVGTLTYHSRLKCDDNTGWLDETKSKIKDSSDWIEVKCVPEDCHTDLIQYDRSKVEIRESSGQFLYKHAVCKSYPAEQLYVKGDFRNESVECEVGIGWRTGSALIGVRPREEITIECRMRACDRGHIDSGESKILFDKIDLDTVIRMNFPDVKSISELSEEQKEKVEIEQNNLKELSCENDKHALRINGAYQKFPIVYCNIAENKWPTLHISGESSVKVDCVEPCKWNVVDNNGETINSSNAHFDETSGKLKCTNSTNNPRLVEYQDTHHRFLKCNVKDGWMDEKGESLGVSADSQLDVQCDEFCLYNLVGESNSMVVDVNEDGLQMHCKQELYAIESSSLERNTFPQLSCSYSTGWTSGDTRVFSDTKSTLNFECAKVCLLFNNNKYLEVSYTPPDRTFTNATSRAIKCKTGNVLTLYGAISRPLTCTASSGWEDPEDSSVHYSSMMPLNTACIGKPLCQNHTNKLTLNGETTYIMPDEVEAPKNNGSGVYSCKNKKIGEDNNAIILNGAFVHSDLSCDIFKGWTDVEGKVLVTAEGAVDIKCGKVKCSTSLDSTIKCDESLKKNNRSSNFMCSTHNFDSDNSTSLRRCGPKQKLLTSTGKIIRGLRCKDDGSWHAIGDERKTEVAKNGEAVFCVEHRCTTCAKPTMPKIPAGAGYSTSAPKYWYGGANGCARASCPSNLWLVGEGTAREYVGDVNCSSTEVGKWKLADGTMETKLACIDEVTTCAEFKLNVACDSSWDCSKINIDQSMKIVCPEDKYLFYRKKDAKLFDEKDGAGPKLEAHCDPKRGWIVMSGDKEVNSIGKFGRIICAAGNPAPISTKTTTTTAKPVENACDLCPPISTVIERCDECSLEKDIDLAHDPTNDKCLAKSRTGGKFQTEKQGEIQGPLECDKANLVWMHNGTTVGKFAAELKRAPKEESKTHTTTVVVLSVCGAIFVLIIAGIVYKMFIKKRKTKTAENSDDSKSRPSEEKSRSKSAEKVKENQPNPTHVSVKVAQEPKS